MNSAQRRKLIRKKGERSFNILMSNCEKHLMRICPACASVISLPLLLSQNVEFGCEERHWQQWLNSLGEEHLVVLMQAADEQGLPEWWEKTIREEAARRAEGFLVNTIGENDGK